MKVLAKVLAGSRLYKLDNPNSDTDWKGLFLPSIEDCLLQRASRNIQSKEGEGSTKIEFESFSLTEFLKLAARGEDVATCMLHADNNAVIETSPTFQMLRIKRARFYTKKMAGMCGYAKSQAVKYGMRADRMAAVERVIGLLEKAESAGVARLSQCWDDLTEGEHVRKELSELDRGADKRVLDVAGKLLPATITPMYALDILCKLRDNYGDRVRAAKSIGGVEWKAISHSFRVGYQLYHIYKDGDFYFPLPESSFLRDIKEGKLLYLEDNIDQKLNDLISEVEQLAERSAYPEKANQKWMDQIVLDAYYD